MLPAIVAAAGEATEQGLFSVDVALSGLWFMDKTNQRDLRRVLRQHDLFAVNPRQVNGQLVLTIAWGDFPPEESDFGTRPVQLRKAVILVINGTSNVGSATLRELAHYTDLYTIRATSRKAPSADVAASLPHVQWLVSDLSRESLQQATRGVEKIFYVMPPAQNRAEIARNLAAVAAANHVQYLVHVSIVGSNYRAFVFHNQCRDAEEAFEASGVPFTHLRCAGWMENLLGSAGGVRGEGALYLPMGGGGMALVAVGDVARAAARLLTRMGGEGVTVDLTGPELLTGEALARQLGEALGRPVSYVSPPLPGYVEQLKSYGVEPWFAEGLGQFYELVQQGQTGLVSSDGPKLLGSQPMTTFSQWARANKHLFQ